MSPRGQYPLNFVQKLSVAQQNTGPGSVLFGEICKGMTLLCLQYRFCLKLLHFLEYQILLLTCDRYIRADFHADRTYSLGVAGKNFFKHISQLCKYNFECL